MLDVRDRDGKVILEHTDWERDSTAFQLYELARRAALRLDERIESAVELLKNL